MRTLYRAVYRAMYLSESQSPEFYPEASCRTQPEVEASTSSMTQKEPVQGAMHVDLGIPWVWLPLTQHARDTRRAISQAKGCCTSAAFQHARADLRMALCGVFTGRLRHTAVLLCGCTAVLQGSDT